jgi:hypothetical protein
LEATIAETDSARLQKTSHLVGEHVLLITVLVCDVVVPISSRGVNIDADDMPKE